MGNGNLVLKQTRMSKCLIERMPKGLPYIAASPYNKSDFVQG